MRSSQAAFDLIIREEVSSKEIFDRKYRRPEWPGEASGPTVGIGYDLGQTDVATIRGDWKGRVSDAMLEAMLGCSGKTGGAGRAHTQAVRSLIDIPWAVALDVHKERVMPRWEGRLAANLPNTNKLSGDCFGALLSLCFNRGIAFGKDGDRYKEMRAIKAHMAMQRFDLIPAEIRAMKRLWPEVKGLRDRRDREAALFEKGLKNPTGPIVAGGAGTVIVAGGAATTAKQQGLSDAATFGIIFVGVVLAVVVTVAAIKVYRKKG